mmetsp:Transcript_15259/g.44098  ORF Transcript_15259/g.44098 Transcript_15259/m.44098 type:complete len:370 (+) Transcript_15259:585-1694(+)
MQEVQQGHRQVLRALRHWPLRRLLQGLAGGQEALRALQGEGSVQPVAVGHRPVHGVLRQAREVMQAVRQEYPFRPGAVGQRLVQRLLRWARAPLQDVRRTGALGAVALGHPPLRPVLRPVCEDLRGLLGVDPDRRVALGHWPVQQVLRQGATKEDGFEPGRPGRHYGAVRLLRRAGSLAAVVVPPHPGGLLSALPDGRLRLRAHGRQFRIDGCPGATRVVGGLPRRAGGLLRRHTPRRPLCHPLPLERAARDLRLRVVDVELAAGDPRRPGDVLCEACAAGGAQPGQPVGDEFGLIGRLRRALRLCLGEPRLRRPVRRVLARWLLRERHPRRHGAHCLRRDAQVGDQAARREGPWLGHEHSLDAHAVGG